MVKIKNDRMRQSQALQALSQRVQDPAAEENGPSADEKNLDANAELSNLVKASRVHQEELGIEVVDAVSNQWLLVHYMERMVSGQLYFYSFQPGRDEQRAWLREFWTQLGPLASAASKLSRYYRYIASHKLCKASGARIPFLDSCAIALSQKSVHENATTECLSRIVPIQLAFLNILMCDMRWGDAEAINSPTMNAIQRALNNDSQELDGSEQINDLSSSIYDASETELPVLQLSSVNNLTLELFGGIFLWHDILNCASTGMEPQHSDLCKAALEGDSSKIRLESLMGCKNWAMLLIREIAAPKVFKE